MGRLIVGGGLVMMVSAVAFLFMVSSDASVPGSVVAEATVTSFWGFVGGALVAIAGGLRQRWQ